MKNLCRIAAFAVLMIGGIGSVQAQSLKQDANRPEAIAKQQVEVLSQELNLTGDQQRAVFRALASKESNYQKHVTGKDLKNAKVMADKKKYDETLDAAMKKALTKEQYQKWLSRFCSPIPQSKFRNKMN